MRKLVIRERDGRYHLENLGPSFSGADGRQKFSLVIESKGRGLHLEFPEASLFDLFPRFDLRHPDFLGERFSCSDFVRISEERGECVVETSSGTLYDFFRERAAQGHCLLHGTMPIQFYRRDEAA